MSNSQIESGLGGFNVQSGIPSSVSKANITEYNSLSADLHFIAAVDVHLISLRVAMSTSLAQIVGTPDSQLPDTLPTELQVLQYLAYQISKEDDGIDIFGEVSREMLERYNLPSSTYRKLIIRFNQAFVYTFRTSYFNILLLCNGHSSHSFSNKVISLPPQLGFDKFYVSRRF